MNKLNAMNRRRFLQKMAVGTGAAMLPANTLLAGYKSGHRRPNLVFIFSDQQSNDMLGCYGNDQVITPNLDRFSTESVRFSHCISQYPVCTAYRSMLLSGQHVMYNGCLTNSIRMLPGEGRYFGEIMRDAGYRMGYIGKWHLFGCQTTPIDKGVYRYGFDGTFLSNNCDMNTFWPGKGYYYDENGKKVFFEDWEPYGQTRQALEFLDGCEDDKPFALFLSWHAPHDQHPFFGHSCYEAPAELMSRYDPDKLILRPNCDEELFRQYKESHSDYIGQCSDIRVDYHGYNAMCTGVDNAFGRIMEKLKRKNIADNTIVVYTSDHGCSMGSWTADIYDVARREDITLKAAMSKIFAVTKGTPHDWSIRVPLMIRWPGHLKPRVSPLLFGSLDFMPTLLSMMDLKIPSSCQGSDLYHYIDKMEDDAVKSLSIFTTWWSGVFTHRYTYASTFASRDKGWMWDKQKDPWQMYNLHYSDKNKSLKESLHAETVQHMARFGVRPVDHNLLVRMSLGLDPALSPKDLNTFLFTPGKGLPIGRPIDIAKSLPGLWPELK